MNLRLTALSALVGISLAGPTRNINKALFRVSIDL